MVWGAGEWALIISAGMSAGFGGILASIVQSRIQNTNTKRNLRREKLETISTLSVEAEKYIFAEQGLKSYTTVMVAVTRQLGNASPTENLPSWVSIPEALPYKNSRAGKLGSDISPYGTGYRKGDPPSRGRNANDVCIINGKNSGYRTFPNRLQKCDATMPRRNP